jgi:hypothetical protein
VNSSVDFTTLTDSHLQKTTVFYCTVSEYTSQLLSSFVIEGTGISDDSAHIGVLCQAAAGLMLDFKDGIV